MQNKIKGGEQEDKRKSRCMRAVSSLLPEGLAVRVCVLEAHLLQFAAAVELIMARVSLLSQVLHVHSDQHFSQFDEVTVILIFHCEIHIVTHECFTRYISWHLIHYGLCDLQ